MISTSESRPVLYNLRNKRLRQNSLNEHDRLLSETEIVQNLRRLNCNSYL